MMVVVALLPNGAVGFGDRGHRIVAQIALDEMSKESKAQLSAILGERTLPGIASEPDRWRREQPETGPMASAEDITVKPMARPSNCA